MNIINNNAALASIPDKDEWTPHTASNVYIATFITGWARVKLYEDALLPLQQKVVYMDTDSVIYVSPDGNPLIAMDTSGEMGFWTNEAKPGDHFVEFVSSGPKSYGLRSHQGRVTVKSKGFFLNHANTQIFNFESLKEQVISRTRENPIDNLVLHKGETTMQRAYFQVTVKKNSGKSMNMPYDKRYIQFPFCHAPTVIETYPWGHQNIGMMTQERIICLTIRQLVKYYADKQTIEHKKWGTLPFELDGVIESRICSFLFTEQCYLKLFMCKKVFESECTTKHMFSKKHNKRSFIEIVG